MELCFDLTRMLFPSSAASGPLDRDAQGVLLLALGMLTHTVATRSITHIASTIPALHKQQRNASVSEATACASRAGLL